MTEYALKLSPIVKEEELIAMGFVKSLGKFFGGFEEKKGVISRLVIDFRTKDISLAIDNDGVNIPETVWKKKYDLDEEEVEYMEADEVEKKYQFDLGFEIPQVLLQMLMTSQINITKKEEK